MWQVQARCIAFSIATLGMVRIADKRFIGKHTAFDVVLAVMLGSTASRAITEGASSLGKILAALTLVALHLTLSKLAFHSDWFGTWIKGSSRVLVRDGEIQWDAMTKAAITETDLQGMLRSQASSAEMDQVEVAHLERSGEVSFMMRDSKPQVIDVAVADGVQTVSIRLT